MKTLFSGFRVADLDVSLDFYTALGYDEIGRVDGAGAAGLTPGPMEFPGGSDGPRTAWLTDPDGYRIELVEWPAGHADGLTAADFA